MSGLTFDNKNGLVRASDFEKAKRRIALEIPKIKEASQKNLEGYKSINLPSNKKILEEVQELAKQKQALGISAVLIMGIGGSLLGTQAVYEALKGKLHDETEKIKILFIDNIDSDTVNDAYKITEGLLKSEKNILINVVSESGTTTETITNFHVFLELLKKHRKDYQKYIVITTK
ncbi:MAG: hypothetical protein ACP5N3_00495, partial [Candidatus Nanoarchaeia archaeon]